MICHKKHLSFINKFKPGYYAKYHTWKDYFKILGLGSFAIKHGEISFNIKIEAGYGSSVYYLWTTSSLPDYVLVKDKL